MRHCYCQLAEADCQSKAPAHRVEDGRPRDSAGMGGMGPRPAGTGPRGDRKASVMGGHERAGTRPPLVGTGPRGDEMVSTVARRGRRMSGCASTRCAGSLPRQSGMAYGAWLCEHEVRRVAASPVTDSRQWCGVAEGGAR